MCQGEDEGASVFEEPDPVALPFTGPLALPWAPPVPEPPAAPLLPWLPWLLPWLPDPWPLPFDEPEFPSVFPPGVAPAQNSSIVWPAPVAALWRFWNETEVFLFPFCPPCPEAYAVQSPNFAGPFTSGP